MVGDITVMTFIHICTCSSCCTPVLVLCPWPGPVLHVYVHFRTFRSSWIQVRCQSCRVDCVRQSDLYVNMFLHQSSRDHSTRAYWLHPVLSGRLALGDSDICASLDDGQTIYNWLSHEYIAGGIWHIINYIAVIRNCSYLCTYYVLKKLYLFLRRGVSTFKNKGFIISIVLLTHSNLVFRPSRT